MLFVGSIIVAIPNDAFGTRTYAVVIPLIVFSAYGMYSLLEIIMRFKNKLVKTAIMLSLTILIGYSCVFYFTSYFFRFPIEYAKQWGSENQKTVQYISSIAKNYNSIVFDDSTGFIYTTLLFYAQYPPQIHQQQAVYRQSGLVMALSKDGKYEFRKVDWQHELIKPGTLFITGVDNIPPNITPLATFSYPTRPVVIYYDRKIAQYPTTETAYKIFQSGNNK